MFRPRVARRTLRRYRARGLDETERSMVASATVGGLDGARVLEIGGGIGTIQAELLAAGAATGEVVELVSAYEPYARELAAEKGLEDRTMFHVADLLDEPDAVEAADFVVLNRVVCCSPDGVALAVAACRLARRTVVLSFPRDVFWVRAAVRALNASFWLTRNPFRVFVHRPAVLFAAAETEGVHLAQGGHGAFWQWAALHRAS